MSSQLSGHEPVNLAMVICEVMASLESAWNLIRRLHGKKPDNREKPIRYEEEKLLFHQDNASGHRSITYLLLKTLYSPDLVTSDCYLFAETEALFVAKDKSLNKKDSKTLEKR